MADDREQLLLKYTTPGHSIAFSGRNKVSKVLNETHDFVEKDLLSYNYAYQKYREPKRPRYFNPYFAHHPRQQVHSDLIDMQAYSEYNDGVRFLLVVIDIFTRQLWVRALKTKQGTETRDGLASIFDEMKPIYPLTMQVDYGKEYRNRHVTNLLRDLGIKLIDPYSENKAVFAERVNYTLQQIIYKYMTEKATRRYIDVLPKLVETYNKRPHNAFYNNFSPSEAELHDNLSQVKQLVRKKKEKVILKGRKMKPKFKLNDIVRLRLKKKAFERGYGQKFSDDYFKVIGVYHDLPVIMYEVKSMDTKLPLKRKFYAQQMQLVKGDVYRIEKVLKTRKRRGVEESLVKWENFSDKHNKWIPSSSIINLETM